MADFNYVNVINSEIQSFTEKANKIALILKEKFKQYHPDISNISDNSFTFKFLNLDFIFKIEISIDHSSQSFKFGELNTYLIKDEKQSLIYSMLFDKKGNIQSSPTHFSDNHTKPYLSIDDEVVSGTYYANFASKLMKFTCDDKIKFQII